MLLIMYRNRWDRHKLSLLERIDLDNNQIQGKYVCIEREIDNNFKFLFELKVESG